MTDRSPLRSATPGDDPGPLSQTESEPAEPSAPTDPTPSAVPAEPATSASTDGAPDAAPVRHRARPPLVRLPGRVARATGRGTLRAARATGRGTVRSARRLGRWAHRPSGRFVLPALALLVVFSAAGTAGAYVVPAASPSPTPTHAAPAPSAGDPGGVSNGQDPVTVPQPADPTGVPGTAPLGNPVDQLKTWAQKYTGATGIPVVALQAYGYASLVEARRSPTCHLAWTTLAGIGKVESDHGRENGAAMAPDGTALPPIIGPALNGQGGTQLVRDTDSGVLDGDRTYDHAVGPMQFLPLTWERYQQDANQDGKADPNNIEDAALAAADYLCAGQKDLATPGGWWLAVLSYNEVQTYAQNVFDAANQYGVRSKAVA